MSLFEQPRIRNTSELDAIFALLNEHSNKTDLEEFLREAKKRGDKSATITGNKEELIRRCRHCVDNGTMGTVAIEGLIREGEENGKQHIFLYHTQDEATIKKLNNPREIAIELLGHCDLEEHFPKFLLNPNGLEISDFRINGLKGWTLKYYFGTKRLFPIDLELEVNEHPVTKEQKHLIAHYFESRPSREVILVKWHGNGTLEMRVPSHDRISRESCLADRDKVWDNLTHILNEGNFIEKYLYQAMVKFIERALDKDAAVALGHVSLEDESGNSLIDIKSIKDNLGLEKSEQIRTILTRIRKCKKLITHWKYKVKPDEEESVRCVVNCYEPHGFFVSAKVTRGALDYVVSQFL